MGTQKVPGMAVLLCNDRTNSNAYLITFKVGPLSPHTLAPSILPLWEYRRKAPLGIFRSSAVTLDLLPSMVVKRVPFRPIFRVGNSQTSLGACSGEYGARVMTRMFLGKELLHKPLSRCFHRTASRNPCYACT
jgi:hypothetical protein